MTNVFRQRTSSRENEASDLQETLNIFSTAVKDFNENDVVPPLIMKTDMPEGVPYDIWNKLVEFRDRKIAIELDIFISGRNFKESQNLLQSYTVDIEAYRIDIEKITNEIEEFEESKFQSRFNVEHIYELKQGQIEVPQAPIVTDYSDAILIHRSVVEKLNEEVIALGNAKVEALTEIKDYRKGIHGLEW